MQRKFTTLTSYERGFTLIEVLVVVGILGIIIAIGTDLFGSVVKTSNKASVINQLRQNLETASDDIERTIRAGSGLPANEVSLASPARAYVTVLNSDRTQGTRYQICLQHPTAVPARCLSSLESCPSGTNCVGHMRKFRCTRQATLAEAYDCAQDLGSLTSLDRVSGTDLVTSQDGAGVGSKFSTFTVVPTASSATISIRLVALQGPDAPSRQDFRVCETQNIADCKGIVETSTTIVMRQK